MLAAFVVVLMIAPGSSALAAPGAVVAATSPHAPTPTALSTPASPSTSSSGLPGQNPSNEPRINPVQLADQMESFHGLDAIRASSKDQAPVLPKISLPELTPSKSVPTGPKASTINYGWITGTIVSSLPPYLPLSGAAVSAEPVTGFCPSVGCTPAQTGANGQFTVAASIGENVVLVSDAYYLTNRTWAYVTTDGFVNVGTIELVEEGFVTGVVRGDDPAHEPVAGINVSSISRDGAVVGAPSAHTDGTGTFMVAVPPFPSEVTFTPIFTYAPYQPNVTFVNVSSGQTINIGTVYLEKLTSVEVEVRDAESNAPVPYLGAIQVCSRATQFCGPPGDMVGGPFYDAAAPVGPDMVITEVNGYVQNTSALGIVPESRPGSAPLFMGTVDVVPTGGIQLWANVTGLPVPKGQVDPTSLWPIGEFAVVSVCNEDGFSMSVAGLTNMSASECAISCVPPMTQSAVPASPLRNYITVEPDEIGCLLPGYPTWPIPGDLPVFNNWAWANVTPDRLTNAGGVDLLSGTYIEGQVLPATQTGWTVTACSTDEQSECGEGVVSDQGYYGNYRFQVPQGCVQPGNPPDTAAEINFCVPAPPGPVEIRVTPTNTSQNFTWAYNPPLTWELWTGGPGGGLTPELPLNLSLVDEDHSSVLNITSATVSGRVLQARSLTPVLGLPAVEICPAGVMPSGSICGNGPVNSTGYFKASAPFGWDAVTASAPQYISNTTWVYVASHNSTGIIQLDPYGFVNGFVVDSNGVGVYEATVQLCPVGNPSSCTPVGADGLTSTDGAYYGATPAGPLPVGTYEVKASAPGFNTEWTWVNVTTPGQNFTAPTIVLSAAVSNPGPGSDPREAAAPGASSSSGTPGSWVIGRVIDSLYGIGLPTATIVAAPLSGATPTLLSSIRGTGGEFNDSLPIGGYSLTFSVGGYYSNSFFLNVSGNASVIDLGTIALQPYPTITGRAVIEPTGWQNSVTLGMGLGPGVVSISVCSSEGQGCGPGAIVGTSGNFNASAPAGLYDVVGGTGTGSGPGTVTGGFVSNETYLNVTNSTASIALPGFFGLTIFGIITGSVINANATSNANKPVRYDQITADSTFPVDDTLPEVLTADGTYAIIFPESRGLNMTAGGLGAWVPTGVGISVNGTSQGGNGSFVLNAGATIVLPPISLEHFGAIDAQIVDNSSGVGIPYASVGASERGTIWGLPTVYNSVGTANGAGFVNLTAPPSIPAKQPLVKLAITAPDFLSANRTVVVNASKTTWLNGTSATHMKPLRLESWGWISGQVSDAVNGRLLSGVSVTVSVSGAPAGKTGVVTNGLGLYRIDAPPTKNDTVALSLTGYSTNRSIYNVTYGADILAPPVHLTGDGVVAGRIVAEPGSVPVAGATVSVCPAAQPSCSLSTTTNQSGFFWMTASPGVDAISASVAGYVSNTTAIVRAFSDQWTWAGIITLAKYAYVTGTVIGLPSGLPLAGALASLCAPSLSGVGAGACFATTSTLSDGSFYIEAPAGSYVLDANATDYNDTYLSVALVAGETLPIGLILIQQYGTATGAVYGEDTDLPAPGATVVACASWGTDECSAQVSTQNGGVYVVAGRPGPYEIEASAPGYQTSFKSVYLTSGETITVPTFLLVPIGPNARYEVSGTVRSESNPALTPAGAIVTATGGFSAPTAANGTFSFALPWGNYTLTAEAPGYVASTRGVDVTGPEKGLDFFLSVQTYTVTGTVRDGLDQRALEGVSILENGTTLGVTGAAGNFSIQLANGTHDLVAQLGSSYPSLPFVVAISGGPVNVPLSLYPQSVAVDVLVVNGLSGLPLASVTVRFAGNTSDRTAWSTTATSGADGRLVVSTFPGTYTAVAQLNGYAATEAPLIVNASAASVPLQLTLSPMSAAGSGTSSSAWLYAVLGGVAAAAVAAVVILVARRESPPPAAARPAPRVPSEGGGNLNR